MTIATRSAEAVRRVRQFATLNPQPWAVWAATRTVAAGAIVAAVSLPFGGGIPSIAYFAVACATSFSVLGTPSQRAVNTVGQAVGAAAGLLVAGLSAGSLLMTAVVAVAAGFASGLAERMHSSAVTGGALMLLVTLAYGSFAPLTVSAPTQALWYLIGSGVVALLAALPIGRSIAAPTSAGGASTEGWGEAAVAGGRLALCFGTGMVVAATLNQGEHSFWLPLTVAVVVRSEYGAVTARVASRIAGTIAGASLATAVILFSPTDAALAVCAIAGMAFGAFTAPRHYALAVVGITLSALLSGEIGLDQQVIPLLRLTDTLLGCLIALVLGHLVWIRRRL